MKIWYLKTLLPPFVFNAVSGDIENFQEGPIVLLDLPRKTHAADLQHWCTQSNGHGCSQSAFLHRENKITCKLDSLPYRRSSKNVIKNPLSAPPQKQTNKQTKPDSRKILANFLNFQLLVYEVKIRNLISNGLLFSIVVTKENELFFYCKSYFMSNVQKI